MEKTTILFVIISIICWGIAPIFDKAALKETSPLIGTFIRGISIGFFMLISLFLSDNFKNLLLTSSKSTIYFIISGILAGGIGTFTFYKAMQMDYTSRIVPLVATYPLVTALLGAIFLGENLTMARITGIILIVFGIVLVK